jgi:glycosyltransferase involved in cell wall biosynthesis
LSIIRRKDFNLAQKTNVYVANSLETKKRILECWGRESEVVYPPVNLDFYKPSDFLSDRKDFILGVGRFVGYKNHEFVIRIGETLGKKVVLAGHGPLLESLKNQAANSTTEVEVIDSPSDFELRQLYYDAFCLIYPTFEDFGIVPVEAMGCGLQVLGLSQGGLIETVTNGIAGTLVDSIDLKTFVDGYHDLPNKSTGLIRDSVEKFSSSQFTIEMRVKVSKNWVPHQ